MIKKETWVEVEETVLSPDERAQNIPEATKKTPLKVWVRGNCLEDCNMGQVVNVKTNSGRTLNGKVVSVNPGYYHSFGDYVEETAYIGIQARKMLEK
ncbi:2-amino-4-oxopentanoate thiolase subunit OrtA [Clostridium sp. JN-9]|uniref:2-amino-4-oxopentanoate thiolase subunit OrtA n=1 Tax=Clostridium sp. JN-9 TaxID=2507159 RepID=UPI000FFE2981|nr:2-amino-4-oxopentanoate thiolase subunit OrtA [Clostridium sp. JN-9]QAT40260.1 2-amino-4-ketopentanoate thiolase [Clostridium sp. JN-9]